MNKIVTLILILVSAVAFAQEDVKREKAFKQSNDLVYEGNTLIEEDFISAEKEYRKAISKVPTNAVGAYNLGNAYYSSGYYDEALLRHLEAIKNADTKEEKHHAYHNVGNTLMQQKLCKEAVEAFKNALRNDPTDEESRYNLALAKECAKQQGGGSDDEKGDDEEKDGDDEQKNKDGEQDDEKNKDEGQNKEDQNSDDQNQQDKNEGDEKDDPNGKPQDQDGKDQNPKDNPKPNQPQPGKLSPQQVKNLLEAMNNQEKKVQDKINAKKTKGVKVKTEKDW